MTTLRRTALVPLVVALLATLLGAAPAEAQTADRYERQVRSLTADKREDRDLAAVRKKPCVQRYANRHARRMADQERMFHQDLDRVLDRCNLQMVGENVAYGYSTGRAVVRAWMGSSGHRANILDPDFRQLGVAARRGSDGAMYAVQLFGRR